MKNYLYKKIVYFALIISVLTVAVLFVLFADATEKEFAFKLDLSYQKATSYGSVTKEVLSNLAYPVEAYLVSAEGDEDQVLLNILERYQAASKNFSFSSGSILNNPLLVNKISDSLQEGTVTNDSLVLYCPQTNRTRVLTSEDFIYTSFDINSNQFYLSGSKYEESLTEALIYLTNEKLPSIQRLVGHGEIDLKNIQPLVSLLSKNFYELIDVNLSRGDTLSENDLLVIISPTKDFSNAELLQIIEFINNGGNLIISSDYNSPYDLSNFNSLLYYIGLEIIPGIVISDINDTSSYYKDPILLFPYMQDSEFTTALISESRDRLMFAGARAFKKISSVSSSTANTSILKSGKAFIREFTDVDNTNTEQSENEVLDEYSLAFFNRRFSNEGIPSHSIVIGNSAVLVDQWLFDNTYSVDFILAALNYLNPNSHKATLNISPKQTIKAPLIIDNIFYPIAMVSLILIIVVSSAFVVIKKRMHL